MFEQIIKAAMAVSFGYTVCRGRFLKFARVRFPQIKSHLPHSGRLTPGAILAWPVGAKRSTWTCTLLSDYKIISEGDFIERRKQSVQLKSHRLLVVFVDRQHCTHSGL